MGRCPGPSAFPCVRDATRSPSSEASLGRVLPDFGNARSDPGHGKRSMTEMSRRCWRQSQGSVTGWEMGDGGSPSPSLSVKEGHPEGRAAIPHSQSDPGCSRPCPGSLQGQVCAPVLSSLPITSGCPERGIWATRKSLPSPPGLAVQWGECECVCAHAPVLVPANMSCRGTCTHLSLESPMWGAQCPGSTCGMEVGGSRQGGGTHAWTHRGG